MTRHSDANFPLDRRSFLGGLAAAGTMALLGRSSPAADAPAAKPNSVINGVRIGCITYSYREARINTAEDTLKALLKNGLSEVELMDGPIRSFAGIEAGRGPGGRRGQQPAEPQPQLTDAQRAEQRQKQLSRGAELRKMYNDASVNIHIHKMPFGRTDEDIDFNFQVAKALGCVAITTERTKSSPGGSPRLRRSTRSGSPSTTTRTTCRWSTGPTRSSSSASTSPSTSTSATTSPAPRGSRRCR
jgi:hypothetical protein